jgi:hypothetical protein
MAHESDLLRATQFRRVDRAWTNSLEMAPGIVNVPAGHAAAKQARARRQAASSARSKAAAAQLADRGGTSNAGRGGTSTVPGRLG